MKKRKNKGRSRAKRRRRIRRLHNNRCFFCGKQIKGKRFQTHHIVPISQGGTDCYENQAPSHPACHSKHHREEQLNDAAEGGLQDGDQAAQ